MKRWPTILLIAGLAAAFAGCGGDDESAEGPASVTPAGAAGYFDVSIRPDGEAREGAEAALGKILDSEDPGTELISLIEREAKEDGEDFTWSEDIEPWLGERVGSFPSSLAGEAEAVVIAETTDSDAALEFVSSQEDATGEEQEYEGVSYRLDDDGDAYGIVDDFLVFGRPEGFEQAVDASEGDSLGDSDDFQDAVGELPDDRLATLYAVPKTFLEAIPDDEIDPSGRSALLNALGDASTEPVAGSVASSETEIELELTSGGAEDVETGESALLPQLPGEAWLALGLADIGGSLETGLESVDEANVPGLSADAIRQQLQASAGIDLDAVTAALGDGALYAQGASVADLGGALIIETEDPTVTSALLTRLQGLIKQQADPATIRVQPLASASGEVGFQLVDPSGELAQPIQVVQQGDKIVAGYGAASVQQAVGAAGGETLEGSAAFSEAKDAVGDLGVDAFLSFAPVFQLAEASGAEADPGYQRAKPYLDALSFLAVGSGSEDDRAVLRFIVGLE